MKWYKKQMDELKAKEGKSSEPGKASAPAHSFDARKKETFKTTFVNPVTMRNRNRPKTDSK